MNERSMNEESEKEREREREREREKNGRRMGEGEREEWEKARDVVVSNALQLSTCYRYVDFSFVVIFIHSAEATYRDTGANAKAPTMMLEISKIIATASA